MRAGSSPRYILIGCIAAMTTIGCVELTSPDDLSTKQSGARVEPIPTFLEVQPILMERCTPCHVGEQLNDCPSTCFASFYEALVDRYTCCSAPFTVFEEPPEDCANLLGNMTIGECGLERVINFENDGKDPVPPDQALILKTWVDHGMPE
jgi:hypothetical protein